MSKGGREFIGDVVGVSGKNTVKVAVVRFSRHPLYRKTLRRTKKFLCHAPGVELSVGDRVRIKETRPISKNKHFRVLEKL